MRPTTPRIALPATLAGLLVVACGTTEDPGPNCESAVNFDDPALESVIRAQLNLPTGPISPDSVSNMTLLHLSGEGISSLEGLQCFESLERLFASENEITDLEPLATLTALTQIDVANNPISSLDALADLDQLDALAMSSTEVVDLAPIAELPLTTLSAVHCRIVDPSPLAANETLQMVQLQYNEIEDVSGLVGLGWPACGSLLLTDNPLTTESIEVSIPQMCERIGVNWDVGELCAPGPDVCEPQDDDG